MLSTLESIRAASDYLEAKGKDWYKVDKDIGYTLDFESNLKMIQVARNKRSIENVKNWLKLYR